MNTTKKIHHNVKVAKSRGDSWRQNLIKGKFETARNPSKLRIERLKTGLSQVDLANEIGTTPNTLGAIERGNRPVSKDRAEKISARFGKNVNVFFQKCENNPTKFIAKKF